jgi:hypothetical protein
VRPVQHEHIVEVKIPTILADKADLVKEHLEENKKPYLFGAGGLVLGFAISRIFSRPSINIDISLPKG